MGARKLSAITSKRGNKNFYKGRGAPPAGEHTDRGGYRLDQARLASYTFIAPDLTGFKLLPYVSMLTRHAPEKRAALLQKADMQEQEEAQAKAEQAAANQAVRGATN